MIYAICNKDTGIIYRSVDYPEFLVQQIPLEEYEAIVKIERIANDENEYIKDGVLTNKSLTTDDTAH